MNISENRANSGKILAKKVASTINGPKSVYAYLDKSETSRCPILTIQTESHAHLHFHTTLELHTYKNVLEGRSILTELAINTNNHHEEAKLVLANAAFNIMKDQWLAAPGVVYENILVEYLEKASTPHLMWTEPFTYKDLSQIAITASETVYYLEALPITNEELIHLNKHGYNSLIEALEKSCTDPYDWYRPSSI